MRFADKVVDLTASVVLGHRLARQIDGFRSRREEVAASAPAVACVHLRRSAEAGRLASGHLLARAHGRFAALFRANQESFFSFS